jgi:hypothetical protein
MDSSGCKDLPVWAQILLHEKAQERHPLEDEPEDDGLPGDSEDVSAA